MRLAPEALINDLVDSDHGEITDRASCEADLKRPNDRLPLGYPGITEDFVTACRCIDLLDTPLGPPWHEECTGPHYEARTILGAIGYPTEENLDSLTFSQRKRVS